MQPPSNLPGDPASATGSAAEGPALIRTYKAWKGNNVFFFGGRLMFGPDAKAILLTIFLITAPVVIFCVFVGRKFLDDFQKRGISVLVVAIGLYLLDLIFLLITSARDPGIIPRNAHPPEPENLEDIRGPQMSRTPPLCLPRTKDIVINGITVKIKYCDTCKLYRPPRASHCSICNNCVEKFDHHCPWLGQCIGLRNYRFFFMFVLTSTLLCIYVHVFCWIYIVMIMDSKETKIWKAMLKTPASIALIVYTFIAFWFVGGLTFFHFYLISTNQSTYENFRYRYEKHENPFNKGLIGNFMDVFCTNIAPSKNSFSENIPKEPTVPPRTVHHGLSSLSIDKQVHDIEMGRKPVQGDNNRNFVGSEPEDGGDKIEELDTASHDFSRILLPDETQRRNLCHARDSSRRQSGRLDISDPLSVEISNLITREMSNRVTGEISNRFSGEISHEGLDKPGIWRIRDG